MLLPSLACEALTSPSTCTDRRNDTARVIEYTRYTQHDINRPPRVCVCEHTDCPFLRTCFVKSGHSWRTNQQTNQSFHYSSAARGSRLLSVLWRHTQASHDRHQAVAQQHTSPQALIAAKLVWRPKEHRRKEGRQEGRKESRKREH